MNSSRRRSSSGRSAAILSLSPMAPRGACFFQSGITYGGAVGAGRASQNRSPPKKKSRDRRTKSRPEKFRSRTKLL